MPEILSHTGEAFAKSAPKIVGARPVGSMILFERLTPQELLTSKIHVSEGVDAGVPQGYVLAVGPSLDDKWGIKPGDRVVISGNFTPLPSEASKSGRTIGVCEPHAIKAVLVEE